MPVKSKAQERFMRGVASGTIQKKGLSPAKAQEFISATPKSAKLPARKAAKGMPAKTPKTKKY